MDLPAEWRLWRAAPALALVLGGCATAPAWRPPPPPALPAFPAVSPLTALPGAAAQTEPELPQSMRLGAAVPTRWWTGFGSPALDALVAEAIERHPDVDAARAALEQAGAQLAAARGDYLAPLVQAQGGATRQRVPPATSGLPEALTYNLFNASVAVSYRPDLFGGLHQALEGLGAQVDLQRYQLESVRLTLAANVVTTAFREAGLRAQLEATASLLDFLTEQRRLSEQRLQAGAATVSEVLTAESALDDVAAGVPALDKALAQTRAQLASYVGRPDGGASLPEFRLSGFLLPSELPLSVPSELARQRPDLRAAEAALRAANASVGVAQANRYPSLTLNGNLGSSALALPGLFQAGSTLWSVGGNLAQTVFDGDALKSREAAARAAYAQVEAGYRSSVLLALQDVVGVLAALQHDARSVDAQRTSLASARATLDLVQREQQFGAATRQQVLLAQITAMQAEIPLGPLRALRLADSAALYQALGGDWSASAPPPPVPTTATGPAGAGSPQ